jgi:Raf kinase inhibitor-like YbhB/YbcL family protein
MMRTGIVGFAWVVAVSVGCQGPAEETVRPSKEGGDMALEITSSAFVEGAVIPVRHTADGPDVSPALAWGAGPEGTNGFALICDDPDAPTAKPWVHWVIWGIPGDARGLPEGVPAGDYLQGTNDFRKVGYGGPSPPKGHGTHHYYFKLYALDGDLGLDVGATKSDLLKAMEGHVLAEGQVMGTYERK